MFEYDGVEPLPINAGDEIEVIDEIRRGSVVCFHRQNENLIHIRTLLDENINIYTGPKFIVDKGSAPGTLKLSIMKQEA